MASKYELLSLPFIDESKVLASSLNLAVDKPSSSILEYVYSELRKILTRKASYDVLSDNLINQDLEKYFGFYPFARILLSYVNMPNYNQIFARHYSLKARKIIESNEIHILEILGLKFDINDKYFLIDYKDFCRANITRDSDKFVNALFRNGKVYLNSEQLINFVSRYVANKVVQGLPVNVTGLSKDYSIFANKLKNIPELKRKKVDFKGKTLDVTLFPPCMYKIFSELLEGGKPSHIERYYISTYLFSVGMDFDSVLEVFSKASDYDENIARYQLDKVKTYSPPSCQTMKSMGLCLEDDSCKGIKSPKEYYWKRISKK